MLRFGLRQNTGLLRIALKVFKTVTMGWQGGRDLSYSMLLLYLLGLALWLVYGLRIQAIEVIAANVVGGTLVVAAIAMKRRSQRQDANGGPSCRRS